MEGKRKLIDDEHARKKARKAGYDQVTKSSWVENDEALARIREEAKQKALEESEEDDNQPNEDDILAAEIEDATQRFIAKKKKEGTTMCGDYTKYVSDLRNKFNTVSKEMRFTERQKTAVMKLCTVRKTDSDFTTTIENLPFEAIKTYTPGVSGDIKKIIDESFRSNSTRETGFHKVTSRGIHVLSQIGDIRDSSMELVDRILAIEKRGGTREEMANDAAVWHLHVSGHTTRKNNVEKGHTGRINMTLRLLALKECQDEKEWREFKKFLRLQKVRLDLPEKSSQSLPLEIFTWKPTRTTTKKKKE